MKRRAVSLALASMSYVHRVSDRVGFGFSFYWLSGSILEIVAPRSRYQAARIYRFSLPAVERMESPRAGRS